MAEPSKKQAIALAAVLHWKALQDELARVKGDEMAARLAAIATVYPRDALEHFGTLHVELHDGRVLKCEIRKDVKVDEEQLPSALAKLKRRGKGLGKLLAERLIRWRPSASVRELDQMPADLRKLFDDVITITPSSPSLKLIEPA